ncbi:unnamed protein product, partial [Coregonus sp. 'balchen']
VHLSVSQALAENRPGVVLVSTIITHGISYPHSVSTAKEVEAIVRGRVHVRLSSELDYLAQSKTSLKVSRQDLPYAISKGICGGTTVPGTMIAAYRAGIPSGLLLAVPIPEEHAAASQQIGDAIQAALAEAIAKGIRGRDVTSPSSFKRMMDSVVIGGVNVDFIAKGKTEKLVSFGGVGRNLADSLNRMGQRPLFISAIGTVSHSDAVLNYSQHMVHMQRTKNTSGVARLQEQRTATYCAVITEIGDLSLGLGDMDIYQRIREQYVSISEADGNIPVSIIDYVCSIAKKHAVPDSWKALAYTSPNLAELCTMNKTLGLPKPSAAILQQSLLPSSVEEVLSCAMALTPLIGPPALCGAYHDGNTMMMVMVMMMVFVCQKGRLCAVHYPALAQTTEETVNVSGAG